MENWLRDILVRLPVVYFQIILLVVTALSAFATSLGEAYFPYLGMAGVSMISLLLSTFVYALAINTNTIMPTEYQLPILVLILIWTVGNALFSAFLYNYYLSTKGIILPWDIKLRIFGAFGIAVACIYYVKVMIDPYLGQVH